MRMKKSTMLLLLLLLALLLVFLIPGSRRKIFLWLGRAKEMLQEKQLKRRQNISLY